MKRNRTLKKGAGLLLILMLVSSAQAKSVFFNKTDFLHGTEKRSKTLLSNFRADALGMTSGDSDLRPFRLLELSLRRFLVSDEPIPPAALLLLIGLIALIAMKGRRR